MLYLREILNTGGPSEAIISLFKLFFNNRLILRVHEDFQATLTKEINVLEVRQCYIKKFLMCV